MDYARRLVIVDDDGNFPDARFAPGDFPVAVGWSLTPELMLKAYSRGIFAWSDDPVTWWSPDPRAVFEAGGFHVSRSLARVMRQRRFEITVDVAFRDVVLGCAEPRPDDEGTWITPRFLSCFEHLHRAGYAHSVECWDGGRLAGGVFGIGIGGFFSAESMFHRAANASKVALYHLLELLSLARYTLVDIQILTPHTASLGAVEIRRSEYLRRLADGLVVRPRSLSDTLADWQ